MAEKHIIASRIAQVANANITSLIDGAENPQPTLRHLRRDYTNNSAEAETAVAQTIGNLRMAEQDYNSDVAAVTEWKNKAIAASRKADELRAGGDAAGADRYDNLTKIALKKQISY